MPVTQSISVVIPCHNAARFVCAALRSVLAQPGFELEVIVVDDGSADGSSDVVERSFPSVVVLRQPNRGVAAARNAGIERARHDWIAFLDADDVWLAGKLRSQATMLASNPSCRMAYTAWAVWKSEEDEPAPAFLAELERSGRDPSKWRGASGWIYPDLLLDAAVWTSTVLLHRSVIEDVGAFDPDLRIGEDLDLWLRAARVTPILRVEAPLALYRMHGQSLTRRLPDRNFRAEVVGRALHRWGYTSPDGRSAGEAAVRHSLAQSWAEFAEARFLGGDRRGARRAARLALSQDPAYFRAWRVLLEALVPSLPSSRRPPL